MASLTRQLRFYKNDTTRPFTNPMRRWLYHYLFGGAIIGGAVYVGGRYQLAAWEATRHPEGGTRLCSVGMLEMLMLFPFNYISHICGRISENECLPSSFHRAVIAAIIWWYGMDAPRGKEREYKTLQEFFVRRWEDGERRVATSPVVMPSDGVVLSVQEDVVDDQLLQVKGVTYSVRRLFHSPLGTVAEGNRRIAVALHLRTQDYHHVVTPCLFTCKEVVYIPGALLPHTPAGYHWIPSVLPLNERVVLLGSWTDEHSASGNMGLALVGGTLTGRIVLHLDQRIKTNFLAPPEYAVHRCYSRAATSKKGDLLSTFYWGSSVVLVLDIPKTASVAVKPGDIVKAGEALVTYGLSESGK
ncbi:phosphatidylserine decarboxylase, putative [Trypanosoma equiperdum]|uniref:phosphatidylserine decarboxylase n=4 Tax=Trypanozoon TaxID=39700 RepID=Q38DZ5_TRYB2|nr:phosphatidylserine decarboxylase, putative [Trypanosoma brucei gambiense DAL972]XP_827305.1 phosphatidylserine decarboxylase, putative [Trypanosoma brucei brucei TREU927]RHW70471.1 phosphatidylserine decarboxylase [Trypanosoma brucei equiperdum]SCU68631.1 phosphatidylserine decarboxylase, putative [Trypanosoma equiperdum]EAN76975.1 phosphatidylserine decarboxylase, putative [Trypanosoma brucei brucei TREU927]CBH14508.1 phosphatidylserine decarboxylase, putative [Trypanosoma brucei gambiense|eukprot:XP_011776774.1 phosphatidylserine decarboxylase, putative [Trypanosoma brucei gambiense DAL972]